MRQALIILNAVIQALTSLATWSAGIFIVLTAGIVCYEVVMRGLFNAPTEWSIEFSGYLVLASGFLGLAGALADDKHIKVDLLTSRFPAEVKRIMELFMGIIGLTFAVILLIEGWDMVASSYDLGRTSTSTLRVPLYIPQASVPVGALLLVAQFLRLIVINLAGFFPNKPQPKQSRAEG